jgi:hypothetical protein
MIEVQFEADVPESREVTVTLPPGVPTGRVRLTVMVEEQPVPSSPRPALPHYVVQFDPNQVECFSGQLRVTRGEEPG